MELPIVIYGHPVLRKTCKEVLVDDIEMETLIGNMWESLYAANGAGLAAPQVNKGLKLFVVDTKSVYDNMKIEEREKIFSGDEGVAETFINAQIIAKSDEVTSDFEGCLSIPGITEEVNRPYEIIIDYQDIHFHWHRKQYSGYTARVIQHEYDHTMGVLFIDHLAVIKRKMLKSKLMKIAGGKSETVYKTIMWNR